MDVMSHIPSDTLTDPAVLGENACKARYGITYLRAICSQAGLMFHETSPDEDVLAVDGWVAFEVANVPVQVKCTSQFRIDGTSATWPATPVWRAKWNRSKLPVYFVLVMMGVNDRTQWIIHDKTSTQHASAAFWTRVDGLSEGSNIVVPKDQRLTATSLDRWAAELNACFEPQSQG
jgi:hypothetical protein